MIYQAEFDSLLGSHVVVTLQDLVDALRGLLGVLGVDLIETLPRLQNLLGQDRNVRRLSLARAMSGTIIINRGRSTETPPCGW